MLAAHSLEVVGMRRVTWAAHTACELWGTTDSLLCIHLLGSLNTLHSESMGGASIYAERQALLSHARLRSAEAGGMVGVVGSDGLGV
jgi:hypothetical protein